ncbi:hypothetical protein A6A25_35055 [Saccharothrix sp. CB00851]|nr:hypothetical protein A6A25_35055 [Saccharothrix sp. CB00851]
MASANSCRWMPWASLTCLRATLSTRSPSRSPARSAGPPGTTCTSRTPARWPVRSATASGRGAGAPTTPRYARRTRPSTISVDRIRRVVLFIGIASPRPMPASVVLMPTTSPVEFASAPPELPGLSAASVWITSSITRPTRPLLTGTARPSALTTPAVTEPARPNGLPTAMTSWPTCRRSASPNFAAPGASADALSTARSARGSVPTTVNGDSAPSANTAVPSRLPPTTCALVNRKPSSVNTTADPAPRGIRTPATCGVTDFATAITACEYASSGSMGASRSHDHTPIVLFGEPCCPGRSPTAHPPRTAVAQRSSSIARSTAFAMASVPASFGCRWSPLS